MKIIIGKTAGFCFGVSNAVKKANEALEKSKQISCLGELVHNQQVNSELKKKGLNFIDNIEQATNKVIIRAHGEKKETYNQAKSLGVDIIDLTCPKVIKIHKIAEQYVKKGYYIFLIGHIEHPETKATISYCGKNSTIIEDENDIEGALNKLYKSHNKAIILVQTTFNLEKFNNISNIIKKRIEEHGNIELEIKRTICDTTKERQKETIELSKQVDYMIIIGGKNSSNTNKLYEIAKENCTNTILIETYEELDIANMKKYEKIGIMAGASTPQKSIEKVVETISTLC